MLSTAVAQIVAVNRGDHHVTQRHVGDGLRQLFRLVGVRRDRAAVGHVAERAATGTDGAEDHKGGGTVVETLGQIRARGFLTDGVQAVFTHGGFDALNAR